jgi:hypothetical protein
MYLPALNISPKLDGVFDYIHFFAKSQSEMLSNFPQLVEHLNKGGMLWLSWPKARGGGTDLTLPHVIRIGYDAGLVESTSVSLNVQWSAMKFTHPKPGKQYHNSYGKLPD